MRNNNSDFIQDSKQHSFHPYHLICVAAENILFTINPATLSTNTAQNHSFTYIWTLFIRTFFMAPPQRYNAFKSRLVDGLQNEYIQIDLNLFMVSGQPQPELHGGHQPHTYEGPGGRGLPPSSDGPFKPTDLRKQVQPQPEPRGQIQNQPQKSSDRPPPLSSSQLSERSPYEMLDELFKFVQHKQQK